MMKKTYLFNILLFLIILFPFSIKAEEIYTCDYKEKARLNAIASNITISTDYVEKNNSVEFSVIISNLHPDVYIIDTVKNVTYYYNENQSNPNEIKISGYKDGINVRYEVYSVKNICRENLLTNKYVTFPPYNKYYNDPLCKDLSNFVLCKKWVKVNYKYDEFKEQIEKHLKQKGKEKETPEEVDDYFNKFIEFYVKYYIYILPSIIILGFIGIFILDRKKEFRF